MFFLQIQNTFIYCVSAQTGQAECDVTNHVSGVNQTAKPPKLTHRAPGAQSPKLRTIAVVATY